MTQLSGSPVKNIDVNLDAYTMKRFSDDVVFYWRILKDSKELEGVLMANSTTWIAIGWKPSSLGPTCRSFPKIEDRPKDEPLPQPEPNLEPAGEMKFKSTPKPEPQSEPKAEPEPAPESEFGGESEKSGAKRRSAKADTATFGATSRPDVDVTVQTSVTYQVSTKQGKTFCFSRSPFREEDALNCNMLVDFYAKFTKILILFQKIDLFFEIDSVVVMYVSV